jgi:hypothetical protein
VVVWKPPSRSQAGPPEDATSKKKERASHTTPVALESLVFSCRRHAIVFFLKSCTSKYKGNIYVNEFFYFNCSNFKIVFFFSIFENWICLP